MAEKVLLSIITITLLLINIRLLILAVTYRLVKGVVFHSAIVVFLIYAFAWYLTGLLGV